VFGQKKGIAQILSRKTFFSQRRAYQSSRITESQGYSIAPERGRHQCFSSFVVVAAQPARGGQKPENGIDY
jgi:hypothetical protein